MSDIELDRIDLRIINLLQSNNQITNIELADAVAVSPPTCLRRVRRLREAGIITGDVCLIDPGKIGSYLLVIVEVELKNEDRALMDVFEKTLSAEECVMQCYLVTGETDYVLVVCVKDMREYEKFSRELLYSNSLVNKFRTLTVMSRVKYDTKFPMKIR